MFKIRECKKLMKKCKSCGKLKLISDFRKYSKMKDGYRNKCSYCRKKEYKRKITKIYLNKIECRKFMKVCKICGELKLMSDFSKDSTMKDDYKNQCKICARDKAKSRHSLVCLECGKEFTSMHKKQKFCSKECKGKWDSENKKGENHPRYNKEEVLCDYCGKSMKLPKNRIENCNHHFCSKKCHDKWQTGKNNPCYKGEREEVLCDYCKNPIKLIKSRIEKCNHHFCSKECYSKWKSETQKGKNNPNWNHNLSDEERNNSRHRNRIEGYNLFIVSVLKRDNYTCQITGERGGDLNVHHLNCFSDYKEGRMDLDNCITLSKEIHRLFHKIYGNKHNTKEQFEEFKHRYINKEFKEVV